MSEHAKNVPAPTVLDDVPPLEIVADNAHGEISLKLPGCGAPVRLVFPTQKDAIANVHYLRYAFTAMAMLDELARLWKATDGDSVGEFHRLISEDAPILVTAVIGAEARAGETADHT